MSEVPGTAAAYFGAMIESYDSLIRRAVPRYAEMNERLLEYLPPSPRRILELGCGTGNLTLLLAGRFPGATITTVDASPEMVALTRARLMESHAPVAGRAEFITARFEELSLPDGGVDLVTSAISLHHVVDKGALYRAIHGWLAPGGMLVFADQMAGATPANSAINWRRWLEFCRLPSNCTEEEIASLVDHAEAHDHYVGVPEHFRMLGEAGFAPHTIDCVWRNWMWGVITAVR
jgi:tRNA (cmo5U34)-methyltransferase